MLKAVLTPPRPQIKTATTGLYLCNNDASSVHLLEHISFLLPLHAVLILLQVGRAASKCSYLVHWL